MSEQADTMTKATSMSAAEGAGQVTVLGLGDMGSAIARTFLERGFRTTVWNRTAAKAAPLADAGATAAATAAEAVAASPLVVVCCSTARRSTRYWPPWTRRSRARPW